MADEEKTNESTNESKEETFDSWSRDFDTIMSGDNSEDENAPETNNDSGADDNDGSGAESDESPAGDDKSDEFAVLGWSKEDLSRIGEINPKLLEDVKLLISKSNTAKSEDEAVKKDAVEKVEKTPTPEPVVTPDELKLIESKAGKEISDIFQKLLSHTQTLAEQLGTVTSERQAELQATKEVELVSDFRLANTKMDELAKDFPLLGKTDKLPRDDAGVLDARNRAVREREIIWNHAEALRKGGVVSSFAEAVDEAVTWYRGKHGENLAMRKVVKDLNSTKAKFSPRPTHKKTGKNAPDTRTPEGKETVMTELMEQAGIKL